MLYDIVRCRRQGERRTTEESAASLSLRDISKVRFVKDLRNLYETDKKAEAELFNGA